MGKVSGWPKAVIDYAPNTEDDYLSPPIQRVAFEAGEVIKWRAPSIVEQVMVLNLSGGVDEAHAIALPASYCTDFSTQETDPRKTTLSILDVFKVTADFAGNYLVEADSSVKFVTPSFSVDASEVISMQTKQYNRTAKTNTRPLSHKRAMSVLKARLMWVTRFNASSRSYAPGLSPCGSGANFSDARSPM